MASIPSTGAEPSTNTPDLMNDPEYATNGKDEPDTCRICRSEGGADEPLFYPCKCSGSIKFVHQDCLVEWLSHSQKKHCELCKTRFRFTKLYDPKMPQSLPTTVFIRKAFVHFLKSILTWGRALLVVLIWLVWLPWSMRFAWRSFFWLADTGWSQGATDIRPMGILGAAQIIPEAVASVTGALSNQSLSESLAAHSQNRLHSTAQLLSPAPQGSAAYEVLKRVLFLLGISVDFYGNDTSMFTPRNSTVSSYGERSLLAGLPFLEDLTPAPVFNHMIIDVLEGLILTSLILIVFVLLFLIREWVVQQQPGFDLAGAGANILGRQPELRNQDGDALREEQEHRVDAETVEVEEQAAVDPTVANADTELDSPRDPPSASDAGRRSTAEVDELTQLKAELKEMWDSLSIEDRRLLSQSRLDQIHQILGPDTSGPTELSSTIRRRASESDTSVERIRTGTATGHVSLSVNHLPSDQPPERTAEAGSGSAVNTSGTVPTPSAESPDEDVSKDVRLDSVPRSRPSMLQKFELLKAVEAHRELDGESWERLKRARDEEPNLSQSEAAPLATLTMPLARAEVSTGKSVRDDIAKEESDKCDAAILDSSVLSAGASEPTLDHDERLTELKDIEGNVQGAGSQCFTESTAVPSPNVSTPSDAESTASGQRNPTEAPPAAAQATPDHSNTADAGPNTEDVGMLTRVLDWLWGDVAPAEAPQDRDPNDEHVVNDLAEEAPFVRFAHAEPAVAVAPANEHNIENVDAAEVDGHHNADHAAEDPEVAAAARQAGINPIEEGEDLEGFMELFGMQGPIVGLLQNAIFASCFVSATITCAVGIPYLCGKLVLLLLGNPTFMLIRIPIQLANGLINLLVDVSTLSVSLLVYWMNLLSQLVLVPASWFFPLFRTVTGRGFVKSVSRRVAEAAFKRITTNYLVNAAGSNGPSLPLGPLAALRSLQDSTQFVLGASSRLSQNLHTEVKDGNLAAVSKAFLASTPRVIATMYVHLAGRAKAVTSQFLSLARTGSFAVSVRPESLALEGSRAYWTIKDRLIAVLAGYCFFALAGAVYLRRGRPFSTSQQGRRIEGVITEVLQQAGGVLKVIFIISIEMIAFPLYCGVLLDVALLPLFETATVSSRISFALTSPWISVFLHWFVGTCYMFHFALFVSMCRRILRSGVLYFIRDPDDPSFHPVRDVLERRVSSQLRKIAFSAVVYGALVIVCLGMVVWGLSYAWPGVLPLRWTSNGSAPEFPLDILLYNLLALLAPLLVASLKLNTGMQAGYDWWLRRCARVLRLSHFMFGQPDDAEEDSQDAFRHTRTSWRFWRKSENTSSGTELDKRAGGNEPARPRSGRYVRAPASDSVRIPRGRGVFIEIAADDERVDGQEATGKSPHGRKDDNYTRVYIPPWFKVRIGLFLGCLWAFSAALGLGVTVVPLLLGRYAFHLAFPDEVRMNDIYSLATGNFMLAGFAFLLLESRRCIEYIRQPLSSSPSAVMQKACRVAQEYILMAVRLMYTYSALAIFVPCLLFLVVECFFVIPLRTYLDSDKRHIVHAMQDWTLGFLYSRVALRYIISNQRSRPARALAAVMRDGYLNPNARLATRCFIMPLTVLLGISLLVPLAVGFVANKTYFYDALPEVQIAVYRFAYPAVAGAATAAWLVWSLGQATGRWRKRIRDEVYLIGERLHNFGETRAPPSVTHRASRVQT